MSGAGDSPTWIKGKMIIFLSLTILVEGYSDEEDDETYDDELFMNGYTLQAFDAQSKHKFKRGFSVTKLTYEEICKRFLLKWLN